MAPHTPCTSVSASPYVALLTENPSVKPAPPAPRSHVSSSARTGAGRRPWRGQCGGRGPGPLAPIPVHKASAGHASAAPRPASADSCTRRCAEQRDAKGAPGPWGLPARLFWPQHPLPPVLSSQAALGTCCGPDSPDLALPSWSEADRGGKSPPEGRRGYGVGSGELPLLPLGPRPASAQQPPAWVLSPSQAPRRH